MRYFLIQLLFLHVILSNLFAQEIVVSEDKKLLTAQEIQIKQVTPYIAVSDIPEEVTKVRLALKDIANLIKEEESVYEIHEAIPSYITSIDELLDNPLYDHLEYLSIRELQKTESEWVPYIKQLSEWELLLKSRIDIYDDSRVMLEGHSKLWSQTHVNANKEIAPQVIQDNIASVLIEIEELRNETKNSYDKTLTDLNSITTKVLKIQEIVKQIKEVELAVSNKIFYQNQLPLFEQLAQNSFSTIEYFKSAYRVFIDKFQDFRIYHENSREKNWNLFALIVVIVLYVGYFNYLYRKRKLFVHEESMRKKSYFFIKRPISTILILIELSVVFIYPDIPKSVLELEIFIMLIPIFRILQTLIPTEMMKYFYLYFILYFFSLVEKNAIGSDLDSRVLNIILSITLLIFLIHLFRQKLLEFISSQIIQRSVYKLLFVFSVALSVSIFANLYGAVLLSNRITEGVFRTIQSAMIFTTLTVVLTGYVVIMLRRRMSSTSHILDKYSQNLERTISFLIKLFMFSWWFITVTKVLGVYTILIEIRDEILTFSWTIATTIISVQSIFDFIIIIVGTWFLARAVRIVLEVEIFARFTFGRGIPTAISTTLNYIIVITGTIIAFSSLGITSEQFTLVLGALGVGIGFGLRNIIANFVSGIIMVFERPIQIGDTIEIDSTMGTVLGIGTRSSSIRTFDGSEVIIPNADFIATKVTNWTLSDDRRRKVLLFKVDFDSDIDKVLRIMKDIAVKHPDVLKDPVPLATFAGFGEYYLEFKLYFWLSENLIVAQSDIAIGVYKSLKASGIKMPLPKQENLLKNDKKEELL